MSVFGQALLIRRLDSSREEFKKYYIEHHGRLVLPYFLDVGVRYYAQIHNLRWTSPAAQQAYPDIELSEWDAAAECVFGEGGPPGSKDGPAAKRYYEEVILPDERRFLRNEALKHMVVLEAGSVEGSRVEFVVDGEAMVGGERKGEWAWEIWRGVEREVEGKD